MSTVQPRALVVRWNRGHVWVHCPYCDAEHTHSTGEPPWTGQARSSHCGLLDLEDEYTALYPYESDPLANGYGWELDKDGRMFHTVNRTGRVALTASTWPSSRTPTRGLHNIDILTRATAGLSVSDSHDGQIIATLDSTTLRSCLDSAKGVVWAELTSDVQSRRNLYFLCCKKSKHNALLTLFADFKDDFASMTTDEGDNGILLAVSGREPVPTIRRLRHHGVSLHHVNMYGRTALMEAALWGQAQTVMYLTGLGAEMQDTRNAAACHNRQMVAHHLSHIEQEQRAAADAEALAPVDKMWLYYKTTTGQTAVGRSLALVGEPDPNLKKAFGTLDRGRGYPAKHAMSGYSQSGFKHLLNNRKWTDKSMKLCKWLKLDKWHTFATDQMYRGYVSHVEKQLAAYYIERHCLIDADKSATGANKLAELVQIQPPHLPVACISISRPICWHCKEFFRRLKEELPAIFDSVVTTQVVDGTVPGRVFADGGHDP
ncbi:hypothetical protein LTR56_006513 [Elasticomyces elasticus]|nr:hypothetical protein LTR22_022062 [Elasticomyces elasticus]KAK3649926.1 hypothetical protein LTR56_006513 [Elasticomyces elasticus]KAK4931680.1 hypothetical protein LTR49_001745 [Elasticomyces elasticus]KAK5740725.1 hypothetical protein LTS12_024855 [Elasticomyces elasticus]